MSYNILVVDDEDDIRSIVADILQDAGYTVRTAGNSAEALQMIEQQQPALVILDVWLQGSELDGIGVLELIRERYPDVIVVVISGHGNIETAISAIKLGAYDYIEKPFNEDKLLLVIRYALEASSLKEENKQLKARNTYEGLLVGTSPAIIQLRNEIQRLAQASSRVLISGPAGTGKKIIARLIHDRSKRAKMPFVVLNAVHLKADKQEQEFFGREYQGKAGRICQPGLLEQANNGTLFIDEVGNMPLDIQGKFLRILQGESFKRLGGTTPIRVNIRVIASTRGNLLNDIKQGRFREDLYYRLNVTPINVPALNERKEDMSALYQYYMAHCAMELGVRAYPLDANAMTVLHAYTWPGNIRQLRNIIEWLLIMIPDDHVGPIQASMLPQDILQTVPGIQYAGNNADILSLSLREARKLFEKQYLTAQLQRFSNNISRTARFIGMERSAFHRKLKSLDIHGHDEEDKTETGHVIYQTLSQAEV